MALGTVNYKMNPMIFWLARLMSGQIIAINLSRPSLEEFSFKTQQRGRDLGKLGRGRKLGRINDYLSVP